MAPETVGFEDPSQQGVQPVEPWQDPEKKGIVSCRVKDEKKKKTASLTQMAFQSTIPSVQGALPRACHTAEISEMMCCIEHHSNIQLGRYSTLLVNTKTW